MGGPRKVALLPPHITSRLPTDQELTKHSADSPTELFFYTSYLKAGITFPFPPLLRDFCIRTGLAPSQLHPNVYRILYGIVALNRRAGLDLGLDEVLHVYSFHSLHNKPHQYSICPRTAKLKIVTDVENSNKAWDAHPIVLVGEWGHDLPPGTPPLPRDWNLNLMLPRSLEVKELDPEREAVLKAALECEDRRQSDLVPERKRKAGLECSSLTGGAKRSSRLMAKKLVAKYSTARAGGDVKAKPTRIIHIAEKTMDKPWAPTFMKSKGRSVTLTDTIVDDDTSGAILSGLVLPKDKEAWGRADGVDLQRDGCKQIFRGFSKMLVAMEKAESDRELAYETFENLRNQHAVEMQRLVDEHKAEILRLKDEHQAELSKAKMEEFAIGLKIGRDQGNNTQLKDEHNAEIQRVKDEHQVELSKAKREEFSLGLKMGQEQGHKQGYNEEIDGDSLQEQILCTACSVVPLLKKVISELPEKNEMFVSIPVGKQITIQLYGTSKFSGIRQSGHAAVEVIYNKIGLVIPHNAFSGEIVPFNRGAKIVPIKYNTNDL